jgi:hypothetical protein
MAKLEGVVFGRFTDFHLTRRAIVLYMTINGVVQAFPLFIGSGANGRLEPVGGRPSHGTGCPLAHVA